MRTILATVALFATVGAAQADQCDGVIELQGFFSRAQFQCGLTSAKHQTVPHVDECASQMSESKLEQALTVGMKMYDSQEIKRGRAATCTELAKSYPGMMNR